MQTKKYQTYQQIDEQQLNINREGDCRAATNYICTLDQKKKGKQLL